MKQKINKAIYEAKQDLNYSIKDVELRKEIVEDIVEKIKPYTDLYFSGCVTNELKELCDNRLIKYFEDKNYDMDKLMMFDISPKCSIADAPTTGGKLSHDDSVCNFLEQLANYLLYATPESKEERKQKEFEKEKTAPILEFYAASNKLREDSHTQTLLDINAISRRELELEPKFAGNYRKQIKQDIIKADIERFPILKEYVKVRESLIYRKYNTHNSAKEYRQINKLLAGLKDDMIYIKDAQAGTIYFKRVTPDSPSSHSSLVLTDDMSLEMRDYQDKDVICDFFNPNSYETILKILPFNGMSDNINHICSKYKMAESYLRLSEDKAAMLKVLKEGIPDRMEYLNYIRQPKEKTRQSRVINKQALYDMSRLAEKLDWSYDKTRKVFDRLCYDSYKAFMEMYEQEFYYVYIVKGKYKKCKKCGKIKLIQRFGELKSSEDGYRDTCKDCRSNK